MRIITRCASLMAGAVSMIGLASATPVTIQFYEDEFTAVNSSNGRVLNPDGVFSGEMTVEDGNNDGIITPDEVLSFSFELENFAVPLLQFDSSDFAFVAATATGGTGGLRELADSGLQWEGVLFTAIGADSYVRNVVLTTVQMSLGVVDPSAFIFPLIAGDSATYPVFSVGAPSGGDPVPLPAAAWLFIAGAAGVGAARRRKA